jgi:hypothetical protein
MPQPGHDNSHERFHDPTVASAELAGALGESVTLTRSIASVIPFDHESSDASFDSPVRAELVAAMAQGRQAVSVRSLTEAVVWHYSMYGQRARGLLVKRWVRRQRGPPTQNLLGSASSGGRVVLKIES